MNESKNLLAIDSESLNLQTSHVFVLHFESLLNSYFLPMIRSHPYQERVARQWLCIEITINLPKKRWSSNRLHACFSFFHFTCEHCLPKILLLLWIFCCEYVICCRGGMYLFGVIITSLVGWRAIFSVFFSCDQTHDWRIAICKGPHFCEFVCKGPCLCFSNFAIRFQKEILIVAPALVLLPTFWHFGELLWEEWDVCLGLIWTWARLQLA